MSVCLIIVIIALVNCHVYYRLIVSRVFLAVTIRMNDKAHKLLFLLLHMHDLHNGREEEAVICPNILYLVSCFIVLSI